MRDYVQHRAGTERMMKAIPAQALSLTVGNIVFDDIDQLTLRALRRVQGTLRNVYRPQFASYPDADGAEGALDQLLEERLKMTLGPFQRQRMRRRIERLQQAANPIHALINPRVRDDERKGLLELAKHARAQCVLRAHDADEVAADLHTQFPWMHEASTLVMRAARRSAARGEPLIIPPLLLCGPPGCGKTSYAQAVARALQLPVVRVDVGASAGAIFDLQGTEAGWGTASTGRLVRTIMATRIVNPLLIVDEVSRAGAMQATSGQRLPGIVPILMSLLERSSAAEWICPYLKVPFDMTRISAILTCNEIDRIDQALLDRCTVIHIPPLSGDDLVAAAMRHAHGRLEHGATCLLHDHLRRLIRGGARPSLRAVTRMIERAEAAAELPLLN